MDKLCNNSLIAEVNNFDYDAVAKQAVDYK
jgi:hypothetical protein